MTEKKKESPRKIKPYISPEDRAMLREKNEDRNKDKRISDYHIDAA